jgi:hypothetical protein
MIVLLILLLTLDFKRPEPPDAAMATSFVVSPLSNEASTGCATNPQGGSGHPLIIERSDPPVLVTESTTHWVSPVSGNTINGDNLQPMAVVTSGCNSQSMVAVPPDGSPPSIPVSTTPEPSTVAILGITAAVLIFLLFGRRRLMLR